MATKDDIESDITLEVDGDVSPGQLAKALTAFSALLNSAHKQAHPEKNMQWVIQVKSGSNLVGFYPAKGAMPVDYDAVMSIQRGLKELENGIDRPSGFTDGMMHNLRTLCDVAKNTKSKKTSVRLWIKKEASDITLTVKSHIDVALSGEFEEYGAIEGRLQAMDADGYQLEIEEPLHLKRISCSVEGDDVFTEAYKLFEKRVEAEGRIKYNSYGIPYEIMIEKIYPIHDTPDKDGYKKTKGILKEYV